jgi:cytochrome c peroxidase
MLGKKLTKSQVAKIKAFLESLTGEVPEEARTVPELPGN